MINNWQIKKLGEVCDFFNGKAHEDCINNNGKYVVVNSKFISSDGKEYKKTDENRFPLKTNDIVMVMSDVPNGKALAKCFVIDKDNKYTLNQRICVIRSNKFDIDFLYYQLSRNNYLLSFDNGNKQTNLRKDDILKCPLLIPPIAEQKRLAGKIKNVFSLKEISIEESKEPERLLNSICVTYFKSNKEYKSALLGDICEIIKGRFPTLKTLSGEYPLVVTAEERKTANGYQIDNEAVCIPLVSSTGHGHASLKRIHYQEGKFALANIMVALISKNKNKVSPKFLFYYLSYYKDSLLVPLMRGGANVTIPLKEVCTVKVNFPDIEKQQEFVMIANCIEQLKDKLLQREVLSGQLLNSTLNYAFEGKL